MSKDRSEQVTEAPTAAPNTTRVQPDTAASRPRPADRERHAEEIGGREGLDPTRYGDWEKNGRCIDF